MTLVGDVRVRFSINFFFSSRRRHTRLQGDWSSDVCSSDLLPVSGGGVLALRQLRHRPAARARGRDWWTALDGSQVAEAPALQRREREAPRGDRKSVV